VRTVPVLKLTVSGGARVRVVPNVVVRTEADAGRILCAAGFVARPIDRAVTDPTQDGRVVEQDPAAGTASRARRRCSSSSAA
jgi:beta-lactam-binding protein with PASTA domain